MTPIAAHSIPGMSKADSSIRVQSDTEQPARTNHPSIVAIQESVARPETTNPNQSNDLFDLRKQLDSLTVRFANLSVSQLQTTEQHIPLGTRTETAIPQRMSRIEVPRLVPVQSVPNHSGSKTSSEQERTSKQRSHAASPTPESTFAPRIPVPTIAPPEQTPSQRNHAPPAAPTINVTIGRVEVKATQRSSAPAPSGNERTSNVMSLQDYIARRRSGGIS